MDDGPANSSYNKILNICLQERAGACSLHITALNLFLTHDFHSLGHEINPLLRKAEHLRGYTSTRDLMQKHWTERRTNRLNLQGATKQIRECPRNFYVITLFTISQSAYADTESDLSTDNCCRQSGIWLIHLKKRVKSKEWIQRHK